jgi:hypothetical protein
VSSELDKPVNEIPDQAEAEQRSGEGNLTLAVIGFLGSLRTFCLTGLIIAFMSPAPFTPEKECYSVLIL